MLSLARLGIKLNRDIQAELGFVWLGRKLPTRQEFFVQKGYLDPQGFASFDTNGLEEVMQ